MGFSLRWLAAFGLRHTRSAGHAIAHGAKLPLNSE